MSRTPLPKGHRLRLDSGAEYVIGELIAEGGFSLVYDAQTAGGLSAMVIKEFFPAEGAYRSSRGIVCPLSGWEERFSWNLARFEHEGIAGGQVADASFQTVSFISCGGGYALMKRESRDMCSVAELAAGWNGTPPLPVTGRAEDRDPVFPDLVRVKYALRVVESLLSALTAVHHCGFLHLDITAKNVIWAGRDRATGRNCSAFLADYGCALPFSGGGMQPPQRLSYSCGFAAPEVQRGNLRLTPATDLYSVGMLLFYLCVGDSALEISRCRKRQVVRELAAVRIPQRHREALAQLILKALGEQAERWQSAGEMQNEVRELNELLPQHPINPDNSGAFTLYSLRSMLQGSLDSRCSWAHELYDRRGISARGLDERLCEPVSDVEFSTDGEFLQFILPREIYGYLREQVAAAPDQAQAIAGVMTCHYPGEWKTAIIHLLRRYGTRRVGEISYTLLADEQAYAAAIGVLLPLLNGGDGLLRDCYHHCAAKIRRQPHVGLAMLIIYALLGPGGFDRFVKDPSSSRQLFDWD